MKILHVIPSVAPIRGGPSEVILATVKALRSLGVEAEIVTTNDNGPDLLDVPTGVRLEYQEVPVWFFPRFSPPINFLREFAFSSRLTSWLWQNAARYDLLHIHAIFSYASTLAMVIARHQNIPYVVRPLGLLCQWSLQQSKLRKQIYLTLIERANLNNSCGLHLTAQKEKEEISSLNLKAPNFIIPHGVPIPPTISDAPQLLRQKLQLPEAVAPTFWNQIPAGKRTKTDEPIILFMSRLHPKKALDYLIPALGKLVDQQFTFIIAGSGSPPYETQIDELLVKAGIYPRTRRLGFVQGELKDLLLQGADLFTLTSHSENFGIAVVEALAAGLPVVITPGVPLANVVEREGVGYVTTLDVERIASSIAGALHSPEARKGMGERARQLVAEQYSWDKIALELIAVYEDINRRDAENTEKV